MKLEMYVKGTDISTQESKIMGFVKKREKELLGFDTHGWEVCDIKNLDGEEVMMEFIYVNKGKDIHELRYVEPFNEAYDVDKDTQRGIEKLHDEIWDKFNGIERVFSWGLSEPNGVGVEEK